MTIQDIPSGPVQRVLSLTRFVSLTRDQAAGLPGVPTDRNFSNAIRPFGIRHSRLA